MGGLPSGVGNLEPPFLNLHPACRAPPGRRLGILIASGDRSRSTRRLQHSFVQQDAALSPYPPAIKLLPPCPAKNLTAERNQGCAARFHWQTRLPPRGDEPWFPRPGRCASSG